MKSDTMRQSNSTTKICTANHPKQTLRYSMLIYSLYTKSRELNWHEESNAIKNANLYMLAIIMLFVDYGWLISISTVNSVIHNELCHDGSEDRFTAEILP